MSKPKKKVTYDIEQGGPHKDVYYAGELVGSVGRCPVLRSQWIGRRPDGSHAVYGAVTRARAARALSALAGLL